MQRYDGHAPLRVSSTPAPRPPDERQNFSNNSIYDPGAQVLTKHDINCMILHFLVVERGAREAAAKFVENEQDLQDMQTSQGLRLHSPHLTYARLNVSQILNRFFSEHPELIEQYEFGVVTLDSSDLCHSKAEHKFKMVDTMTSPFPSSPYIPQLPPPLPNKRLNNPASSSPKLTQYRQNYAEATSADSTTAQRPTTPPLPPVPKHERVKPTIPKSPSKRKTNPPKRNYQKIVDYGSMDRDKRQAARGRKDLKGSQVVKNNVSLKHVSHEFRNDVLESCNKVIRLDNEGGHSKEMSIAEIVNEQYDRIKEVVPANLDDSEVVESLLSDTYVNSLYDKTVECVPGKKTPLPEPLPPAPVMMAAEEEAMVVTTVYQPQPVLSSIPNSDDLGNRTEELQSILAQQMTPSNSTQFNIQSQHRAHDTPLRNMVSSQAQLSAYSNTVMANQNYGALPTVNSMFVQPNNQTYSPHIVTHTINNPTITPVNHHEQHRNVSLTQSYGNQQYQYNPPPCSQQQFVPLRNGNLGHSPQTMIVRREENPSPPNVHPNAPVLVRRESTPSPQVEEQLSGGHVQRTSPPQQPGRGKVMSFTVNKNIMGTLTSPSKMNQQALIQDISPPSTTTLLPTRTHAPLPTLSTPANVSYPQSSHAQQPVPQVSVDISSVPQAASQLRDQMTQESLMVDIINPQQGPKGQRPGSRKASPRANTARPAAPARKPAAPQKRIPGVEGNENSQAGRKPASSEKVSIYRRAKSKDSKKSRQLKDGSNTRR